MKNEGDLHHNEFLTFRLGAEEYGIDILRVQEIRGYERPTTIANAPAYLKGVINLRGSIVPILDLRTKFNLAEARYDSFTVVIILNVARRVIGVVVDSVSDVITLEPAQLRPAPEFGATLNTEFIRGIGAVEDRMLILMDIEKLLSGADLGLIDRVGANEELAEAA